MELEMEMGTELESYTNNDRGSSTITARSPVRQSEELEVQEVTLEPDVDSEKPREEFDEGGECSTSVGTIRFTPSSADTSTSILSMPDPLYSSSNTFSEPSIIDSDSFSTSELVSEYTSEFSSGIGSRIPSRPTTPPSFHQHVPDTAADADDVDAHPGLEVEHEAYSGGELDTESDDLEASDSESSFPSVTSSFFFSSPASQAVSLSHEGSTGEESHEEGDSTSSRGLRATQGLIIPSLTLPESLLLPTPRPQSEGRSFLGEPRTSTLQNSHASGMSSNSERLQGDKGTLRYLVVSTQGSVSEHVAKELLDWENIEFTLRALQCEEIEVGSEELRGKILSRSRYGVDDASAAEIYCVELGSSIDPTRGEDAAMVLRRLVFGSFEKAPSTEGVCLDVEGKAKAEVLGDAEQTGSGPLFIAMILVEPDVDEGGSEDLTKTSPKLRNAMEDIGDLNDLVPTIHLHLRDRAHDEPGTHPHTHSLTSTTSNTPARTSSSVSFQPSAAHYRTSYQPRVATSAGSTGYVYEQSLPMLDTALKTKPTKLGNKRRLSSFSKSQAWRKAQERMLRSERREWSEVKVGVEVEVEDGEREFGHEHVWGVSALRQVLFYDERAIDSMRAKAEERWVRLADLRKGRANEDGRGYGHGHGQEETITSATVILDTAQTSSNSKWGQFKAAWEASWEGMSGEEVDEQMSREVSISMKPREFVSPISSSSEREDDLLRTVRLLPASPSFSARGQRSGSNAGVAGGMGTGTGTLRARRRANASRDGSSSSPSTSSPFPTAVPTGSFVPSLDLPPVAKVPLAAGFPFPPSVAPQSLDLRPHSQDSGSSGSSSEAEYDSLSSPMSISIPPSRTRPRRSKSHSSHNPPVVIDLRAAAFDPLHLPSLLLFSLSLLGPLRARVAYTISAAGSSVWSGIATVFWAGRFRGDGVSGSEDEDGDGDGDGDGVELREVDREVAVLGPGPGREFLSDACSLSVSSFGSKVDIEELSEPQRFAKTVLLAGASFLLGVGVGVGLGLLSGRFCRII